MAIRGTPSWGDAAHSVEQLVHGAVDTAHDVSDIGPETVRVVRGFGVIVGKEWPGAGSEAELAFAESAGASLAEIGLFTFLAMILAAIILTYWVLLAMRAALSNIPIGGNAAKHLLDAQISMLHGIIYWVIDEAESTLSGVLHAVITLVDWAIAAGGQVKQTAFNAIVQSYVDPVKHEADTLWGWLQHESSRITNLYNEVHGLHNAPITGSVPLHEQVHDVQGQLQRQQSELDQFRHELSSVRGEVTQLFNAVNDLTGQLHGVHNVNVGWTDVAAQVAQIQDNITQLGSTLAPQVGHNSAQLAILAPLGMLLQPGVRGLENLRKLEDDICQCPKIGLEPPDMYAKLLALKHELKGD